MRAHTDQPACGVGAALAVGLGSIIGGSVFATMGQAIQGAGSAAPLAFLLGALPAYITAYSYTRMAAALPGAGGTTAYFNAAFGGGYLSASLNLLLVVCYAGIASLYAGVFGSYVADLLGQHSASTQRIISCGGILLVAAACLSPAALSRRAQRPLNAVKFLIMGLFICTALLSPLWNWDNFSPRLAKPASGVLTTGLTIFMSYQGFELMAAIRRPFRSPQRTLPLAMLLCLGGVTLYYCAVAFCTVGNVDYSTAAQESNYLLSAVARRYMGEGGGLLLCAGAVVAAASALNADIFSVSRIPEAMAAEHELPTYFHPKRPGARTPGVIFFCSLLIIFVNLLSVQELTAISSIGFLSIYALANAAALRITPRQRAAHLGSALGAATCLAAAICVSVQTFSGAEGALLAGVTACMLTLPFMGQAVFYLLKRHSAR